MRKWKIVQEKKTSKKIRNKTVLILQEGVKTKQKKWEEKNIYFFGFLS